MAEDFLSIDVGQLIKVAEELYEFPQEILPAVVVSINRVAESTNTQIKREISNIYTVKQKDVKGSIKKVRATKTRPSAVLTLSGGQIAMYKFEHDPKSPPRKQRYKKPVSVQILKGRDYIPRDYKGNKAFIQKTHGNNMIFARKGKARLPMKKLFALSVPQMISDKDGTKGTIVRIQANARETLEKKVNQQIEYRLNKVKGGGKK